MSSPSQVECQGCGFKWNLDREVSLYEREHIESQPCPTCGRVTLACRAVEVPRRLVLATRRRERAGQVSRLCVR